MGLLDDFRGKEEINQLKNQLTEKDVEVANLQAKLDQQRVASELESTGLRNSVEESATTNSTLSRELGQATVAIDRLTKDFEALERSTAAEKSQAAITIANLNKKLADVAPEIAAVKAERDRIAQEIQGLRASYDHKDRGYEEREAELVKKSDELQEREAKLAKESIELLQDRQKFQQQAMDLQRREQRWEQVVKPQLSKYEAHCALDLREQQANALRAQLDEHERSLKSREADLIRRQCTDEKLAKREADIADWDKLLTETSGTLEVKAADQEQRQSELDARTKKLEDWAHELAAFQERAKHLDEEASKIALDTKKLESKEAEQKQRHTDRLAELRQQRTAFRGIAKDLTQREDAITVRENSAKHALLKAAKAEAEATLKLKQAEALNGKLRVTEEQLGAFTLANTALQNRINKLNFEVSGLRHKLTTAAATPAEVIVHEMSVFQNEAVLRWMFKETEPRQLAVTSGYLCTTGTGPWPDDDFKRQLEEKNFSCWEMPDPEVEHIIVGRDDWDGDLLLEQIDSRQGESLRVYSQEMWFAMMATGRDPFDEDDLELLKAFGLGHPALEYLMSLEFPWPLLSNGDGGIFDPPDIGVFVSETPLHKLGYRVGTTSNLTPTERRKILRLCFDAKKLEFSDDSSQSYVIGWGKSESAQRLYRMALHIKSLVDGMVGRDSRRQRSRTDWIADLKWLKSTYYSQFSNRFTWPDAFVR